MTTFEEWKDDYGLVYEPNYSEATEADCKAAFNAGAASRDAEIAELVDVFNKARKFVFEWDNCGSSGEWPVIELADLREALAKVKKP